MTAEGEPRRRRRPALSCVECRRRKIKCDRNDPCGHCKATRIQCVYNIYGNSAPNGNEQAPHGLWTSPASPATSGTVPPASLGHLQSSTPAQQGGHVVDHTASKALYSGTIGTPVSVYQNSGRAQRDSSAGGHSDVQDLIQRVQRLEDSAASSPASRTREGAQDAATSPFALYESQITLNKTRILGWSRWAGETNEVN